MTSLPTTDYTGGGTLKTVSMISKFMEGVKNLVVKKHNLPITKIVDELMEVHSVIYSAVGPNLFRTLLFLLVNTLSSGPAVGVLGKAPPPGFHICSRKCPRFSCRAEYFHCNILKLEDIS